MSEAREFSGWPKPSKVLVRRVRSVLWQYLRARPQQLDESWRLAWEWARCITLKSDSFGLARMRWPSPNEIATQYLLLALSRMKADHQLRLHFRACDEMPRAVAKQLGFMPTAVEPLALPGQLIPPSCTPQKG
jgi:hypothetical protein